VETTQIYLEATLAMKEQALAKLAETPDRRQPAIARRHRISSAGVQVRQEPRDYIDPQVGEMQIGDRAFLIVGQEREQQTQRIAIGTHRVWADAAHAL
jgi:hypothetical protein